MIETSLLDILRNSIWSLKLPFLASCSKNFSTVCIHMLSKFFRQSAQKWLIFPTKANDARSLFEKVADFSVEYLQMLNEIGELKHDLPSEIKSQLIPLYKAMLRVRMFDQKAIYLQRIGKIGTYPSNLGQEAVSAAISLALKKEDAFFPSYRDQGVLMHRGLSIANCFAWWAGDERGNVMNGFKDFPPCIPVATQCLHAAGAAFAFSYKREKSVALVTVGDGGTSKGDFYEAMNLAGVWDLPVVFVINNNSYAISVPLSEQTRCETLAQKAIAAGIKGVQVDGNDPIAMYNALTIALQNARNFSEPCVIEALTYRLFDHTTSDDSKRYRSTKEIENAWKKEPIKRLEIFLIQNHHLSEEQKESIHEEIRSEIEKEMHQFLTMGEEANISIMKYLYDKMPEPLYEQYHQLEQNK